MLSGRGKGIAWREEEQGTGCESKGNHQGLNAERGQDFGEVVDLAGERHPKKQWRKEGDVGSEILEKLVKRANGQESPDSVKADD